MVLCVYCIVCETISKLYHHEVIFSRFVPNPACAQLTTAITTSSPKSLAFDIVVDGTFVRTLCLYKTTPLISC